MSVHVEIDRPLTIVTLDRPEGASAVDRPTTTALAETFRALDDDASQSVGVLTGLGGTSCAGTVLAAMSEPGLAWASIAHEPALPATGIGMSLPPSLESDMEYRR